MISFGTHKSKDSLLFHDLGPYEIIANLYDLLPLKLLFLTQEKPGTIGGVAIVLLVAAVWSLAHWVVYRAIIRLDAQPAFLVYYFRSSAAAIFQHPRVVLVFDSGVELA